MISTAKDFSVDYEISSIKLDIEKTRLLQWAEGVGVLAEERRDQNAALFSPDVQDILERTLGAVELLLSRSEDLSTKYGLFPDQASPAAPASSLLPAVSVARTQKFQMAFARLQARTVWRRKQTPLGVRTKWVIKDREKFENLLRSLHELISSLNELVTLPRSFQRLLVKEDIDALTEDLSHFRLLSAASEGQDKAWGDFTSLRVEASQKATQDFRTLEEWLDDVESQDLDQAIDSKQWNLTLQEKVRHF